MVGWELPGIKLVHHGNNEVLDHLLQVHFHELGDGRDVDGFFRRPVESERRGLVTLILRVWLWSEWEVIWGNEGLEKRERGKGGGSEK